jgi:hypothetical protein
MLLMAGIVEVLGSALVILNVKFGSILLVSNAASTHMPHAPRSLPLHVNTHTLKVRMQPSLNADTVLCCHARHAA